MSKRTVGIVMIAAVVLLAVYLMPENSHAEVSSKSISPYHRYYQNDYFGELMQNGEESLFNEGSALTSLTMIYDYEKKEDKSPADLYALLDYGNRDFSWNYAAKALRLPVPVISNEYNELSDEIFRDEIDVDKLIIIGFSKNNRVQYAVINGYYSNDDLQDFYILDTDSETDYDNMSEYLDSGWRVFEYIIY